MKKMRKIKFVNVGLAVIVRKGNKILMGRRNDTHSHGKRKWCAPGGHIEYGESLEKAAKREVMEETGVKIKNLQFLGVTNDLFTIERKHYITIWFEADYASGEAISTDELDIVKWFPNQKLPVPLFLPNINFKRSLYRSK